TVDESCEDHGRQDVLGDAPAGDAALETVLARLATALGPEGLGSPVLADDHRPEAAQAPGPFRPPRREPGMFAEARRAPPLPPPSPERARGRPRGVLPPPGARRGVGGEGLGALRSARVLGKRRRVLAVAGPERLGGQWWTETPFQRDYYRVHLEGLGPAWVYRRAGEGEFYLHGLFD